MFLILAQYNKIDTNSLNSLDSLLGVKIKPILKKSDSIFNL